ncbi:MAG: hypothetical protein KTR31_05345 [Myxococcales bacterium]|nr:hypothetical protein [Myxococcales bacterium]
MKRVVMILTLVAGAFGLGATGAPGQAIATAVALLVPEGADAPAAQTRPVQATPREGG